METITEISTSEKPFLKIYNLKSIVLGTLIGGPLAAGYFIAADFKALGQPEKVRVTWIYTITGTVILFAAIILIPFLQNAGPGIAIGYIFGIRAWANMVLVPQFNAHLSKGGQLFSHWRSAGIGLGFMVLTLLFLVIFIV